MKSYGQFIDKSIALDESNFVARRFDASRFGPGGNNNTKKPPLQATSKRNPDLLKDGPKKLVNTVKRINQDRKNPQSKFSQSFKKNVDKPTRNIRDKVRNATNFITRQATRPEVRSAASGFNKVRKALPTAADFAPTSQSGLGLGGTLSGRSVKGIGNAVKAGLSADRFEKSDVETYSRAGLGQRKKNLQYINRGRKLGPDGEPINEPKDTSFKGKAKNFIKDKLGITDKVDEPKKPDEDKGANKVTTTGNIPDDDNSGSKVTTGKGKPNPSSGSAAASTSDDSKTASTDASPTARQPRKIRKRINLFKKEPEPDKKVRVDQPKTDPSKLNKVKGFKDDPKQENIPGIKTEKKPETEKKTRTPRKPRTQEQKDATNKKRAETRARNKEEASKKSGQQSIDFNKDQRNQSRKDAVEKTKVKITGSKSPEITGTKTDKVTSSDNVDKTSKPVEKPVEKKSNEISGITDAREKKTPGKKRGPKKGSTNVRTLAKQNRQKKEAKKTLTKAVERQAEADAARDAVKDMKQTPQMGKVTDDVRSQLTKTLAKTESDPNKSTQLKGKSDEELTRSTASSDDEGSFRRNAGRTGKKKTINPNAPKSNEKKNVKKSYKTTSKKKEKTTNEEFSHWREEFLWEVDKKYPDKVKEIKPMSGKNTIIINPEDETSKYKRGY